MGGDIKEEIYFKNGKIHSTKEGAGSDSWLEAVPEGAVLLSASGNHWKAAIAGCDMVVNQAIQAMVFDEEQILPEYAKLEFYRPCIGSSGLIQ